MGNDNRPREDGGYGNSNLVGDSRSGLRSAIESREAIERAGSERHRDPKPGDVGLDRLSDGTASGRREDGPDSSAGMTLDDDTPSPGHGGGNGLEN